MKQREKVLPLCNGVVLEVGAGSGLNFSLYNPDKVSMVYALEPDPEMLKQAREQAQRPLQTPWWTIDRRSDSRGLTAHLRG
jgi:predicted RNA methylase